MVICLVRPVDCLHMVHCHPRSPSCLASLTLRMFSPRGIVLPVTERQQSVGHGPSLAYGGLGLECCGLVGQVLASALADVAKLHYIHSNIQLLALTMIALGHDTCGLVNISRLTHDPARSTTSADSLPPDGLTSALPADPRRQYLPHLSTCRANSWFN